jgi:hypothetical protein
VPFQSRQRERRWLIADENGFWVSRKLLFY